MENKIVLIGSLFEKAEEYGKTSYELLRLKIAKKLVESISAFLSRTIAVLVFSMFIVIANIGLALWLGDLLGKTYYGFFCVAGFYALVGIVLHFLMHKPIKKSIGNSIVVHFLN